MRNERYIPDKEKMKTFVEFISENPNGNYEEFREFQEIRKDIRKVTDNLR